MFETTVDIAAAVEDVWAVMVDVERWPEWTPSVSEVKILDGDQLAVGARVRIKQPRLPPVVWKVTELEPRHFFIWTARSPGLVNIGEHRVTAAGGGGVSVRLGIRRSGPLSGVFDRLLDGVTRRYVTMEAEGLKRRCESAGSAG